jgi:hypothetical protein
MTMIDSVQTRNAADEQALAVIRAAGTAQPLESSQLMPRLRYANPKEPTVMETKLISAMRTTFVGLTADFNSYQNNPTGCGCATKIMLALSQNQQVTQRVLDDVYGPQVYLYVSVVKQLMSTTTLVGTSVVIDATPEAWLQYFAKLINVPGRGSPAHLKTLYSGVHVRDVEQGTKWLLLFY